MDTDHDDGEAKRLKLPKRVAGVKLPKALRHAAEDALAQVASPAGRVLLASALEAAAAALRRGAGEAGTRATGGGAGGGTTVDRIGPMIGLAANALGQWLGEARATPKPDTPGQTGDEPKPN